MYKNIEEKLSLPVNRALYLDKLLKQNSQIEVTTNKEYNKIIKDNNDFAIFDFYNFYEAIQEKVLDNKFSNSFKHLENTNNIRNDYQDQINENHQ